MANDPVSQARALIKAGQTNAAQRLLEPFIEANPHHLQAWLLEAATWPTRQGQQRVLELCLQHNPGAVEAQRALQAITSPPGSATPDKPPALTQGKLVLWIMSAVGVVVLLGALGAAVLWLPQMLSYGWVGWTIVVGLAGLLVLLPVVIRRQGGWRVDRRSLLGTFIGGTGFALVLAGLILAAIWLATPRAILGYDYLSLWVILLCAGSAILLLLSFTWQSGVWQPLLKSFKLLAVAVGVLVGLLGCLSALIVWSPAQFNAFAAFTCLCLVVAGQQDLPRWLIRGLLGLAGLLAVLFVLEWLWPGASPYALRFERFALEVVVLLTYGGGLLLWRGGWPQPPSTASRRRTRLVNVVFALAGLGLCGGAVVTAGYWYTNLARAPWLIVWDHAPNVLVITATDPRGTRLARVWGDGRIIWLNASGTQAGHLSESQMRDLLSQVDFPNSGLYAYNSLGEITVVIAGWRRTHSVAAQAISGEAPAQALLARLLNGAEAAGEPYSGGARYVRATVLPNQNVFYLGARCVAWPADKTGFSLRSAVGGVWVNGTAADSVLQIAPRPGSGLVCFSDGTSVYTLEVFPPPFASALSVPAPTPPPTPIPAVTAPTLATPGPTLAPAPSALPVDQASPVLTTTPPPPSQRTATPTWLVGDLGWFVISGTVTTAEGVPLANATVTCQQSGYAPRAPCFGTRTTDTHGQYSFGAVFLHDTDRLSMQAAAPGYRPLTIQRSGLDTASAPTVNFELAPH